VAMSVVADTWMSVNAPSALIALAVGLRTVLFAHGPEGLGLLFQALGAGVEVKGGEAAAEVALSATKSFNCTGLFGFLVGTIAMLANLNDPSKIGPAVAVAMLTVL
jgi:chemotaxis protein MotA